MNYNLITILGPTAVGKTRLGALLAHKFVGEIISADSRQVYVGMDIGTGKDLSDYLVDGKTIAHHLIDIIEPGNEFNLFSFNNLFYQSFNKIIQKKKIPFLVGGTGLYLHSVLRGYALNKVDLNSDRYYELNELSETELKNILLELNPGLHNTTDLILKDRIIRAIIISEKNDFEDINERTKINSLTIGISLERKTVRENITKRLKDRLDNGMLDEVEKLIATGITFEKLEFFGLEYKFVAKYLKGELSKDEMFQKLNTAIHQFAKRQMTWFRKMEREGIEINWIESADYKSAEELILEKYYK